MVADGSEGGGNGRRLFGIFILSAGAVALYALMDGKTVAQAVLVGISAGFFLPMLVGALLLIGFYTADLVASLMSGVVLLVWVAIDWRNRSQIVTRVQDVEEKWDEAVAGYIISAARWLVGKNA